METDTALMKQRENGLHDAETYYGETKSVSLQDVKHRVSVYGVIVEDNCILMLKTSNNRWYFPGGGLDVGESLQDGVKREVWEELGVQVTVGALLHADDVLYYHDPIENTAQLVRLFYRCYPLSREFHSENAEERADLWGIDWVSLTDMNPDEFLASTYNALQEIRARLKE